MFDLAYTPWVSALAGRLAQVPARRLLTDPGALVRALPTAAKVCGSDVLSLPLDPTLEAEALGAAIRWDGDNFPQVSGPAKAFGAPAVLPRSGRVPVILEAAERLQAVHRETPVLAAMTGPVTLFTSLYGVPPSTAALEDEDALVCWEFACDGLAALARAWGERRPWGLAVVENGDDLAAAGGGFLRAEASGALAPLWKVLRYFQVRPMLQVTGGAPTTEVAAWAWAQPADAIVWPGAAPGPVSGPGDQAGPLRGIALPPALFLGSSPEQRAGIPAAAGRRIFYTSHGEVPAEAAVDACQLLRLAIRGEAM